jgi:hypothetical protein
MTATAEATTGMGTGTETGTMALVRVPFYGDQLDAVQDGSRKVWVSLRRLCDNLGIDPDTQKRKLSGKPWACTSEMTVQLPDAGQSREYTMIDLDRLCPPVGFCPTVAGPAQVILG